jgi:hypothetical protein
MSTKKQISVMIDINLLAWVDDWRLRGRYEKKRNAVIERALREHLGAQEVQTLLQLTAEMRAYNNQVAYGSECAAWQNYCSACHVNLGHGPDDDGHSDDVLPLSFARYWFAVANGESPNYDPETGEESSWDLPIEPN